MSAPHALIEFFQQEAVEYLDRLEQLLAASEASSPEPASPDTSISETTGPGTSSSDTPGPDAAAFLTHARALRGSAAMARLEGLTDLASTVERIAAGLRDDEFRWDQRLHFAVHGALVELRDLVSRANDWGESEQRRSRTQSVALAAVASGFLVSAKKVSATVSPVVPISRFFPDDGHPGVLDRNPNPPYTLPQRFRSDIAGAAAVIAAEAASFAVADTSAIRPRYDGVRRALLALSDTGESYGATSIAALAVGMARAPLEAAAERAAVQSLAVLLQDRARSDQELAAAVKEATIHWPGRRTPSVSPASPAPATPVPPRLVIRDMPGSGTSSTTTSTRPAPSVASAPTPPPQPFSEHASPIVPIESLLYSGKAALTAALTVRDELKKVWTDRVGVAVNPAASALLDELSDLLNLAAAA